LPHPRPRAVLRISGSITPAPKMRWTPALYHSRNWASVVRCDLSSHNRNRGAIEMNRRELMEAGAALSVIGLGGPVVPQKGAHAISPPPLAFRDHTSKLKITGIRMIRPQPRKPVPRYEPAPGSWSTGGALVAN